MPRALSPLVALGPPAVIGLMLSLIVSAVLATCLARLLSLDAAGLAALLAEGGVSIAVGGALANRLASAACTTTAPDTARGDMPHSQPAPAAADRGLPTPIPVAATAPPPALVGRSAQVAGELMLYQRFLGILRDQIGNVSHETEGAALDILTRLNDIDQRIQGIITYVDRSTNDDDITEVMRRAEHNITENRRLLDEFRDSCDHAAIDSQNRLKELLTMVGDLTAVVGQVRVIARQTNMLALNATIEAARAGEVGRGFAVVAGEVKQLSRGSDKAAIDISAGMERLQQAINGGMQEMITDRLAAERAGFAVISDSVTLLSTNLDLLINHQREVLIKVHEASEQIAGPIMNLIGSIQFQDITRQELQQVAMAMSEMAGHSEQLGLLLVDAEAAHDVTGIAAAIERLAATYVMSQQRNIHAAATGSEQHEEKGALVELF